MTDHGGRFRLGVNYWPRSSAMFWWKRFDAGEVREDFARIAEMGFDSARIFTLWEDFQPEPNRISTRALDRLVDVAEIAGRSGVELVVTLFTGHMSGANWIPRWAVDPKAEPGPFPVISEGGVVRGGPANWYSDPALAAAQERSAREIASALRGHPAVWAYDLGNEPSNAAEPPTREAGRAWLERIAGAIRNIDPGPRVTIGLSQRDLEEDRKLGPAEAASVCDFLSIHGYPIYASFARGPDDEAFPSFLGQLTRRLGGKEVLFEELGAPTRSRRGEKEPSTVPLLSEDTAARFLGGALDRLRQSGHLGAMIWCYTDYPEGLGSSPPFDSAPHELRFGLLRSDGSPKPAVEEVGRRAGGARSEARSEFAWFDLDPAHDYEGAPRETIRTLYRRYLEFAGEESGRA